MAQIGGPGRPRARQGGRPAEPAFPNRIKELRLLRGWSQDRLARKARVNWSTISYLERGERGASDLVKQKIAKAFGLAVEDVFPSAREAATA